MKFRRCASPACGRPFQVNQFSPRPPYSYECGKVTCPHCGMQASGDGDSVFLTHALSAKEEAEFNAAHACGEQEEAHAGHERADGYPTHQAHQAAKQKSGVNDGKYGKRPSANACDAESSSHHADHAWGESGESGHSRSQ